MSCIKSPSLRRGAKSANSEEIKLLLNQLESAENEGQYLEGTGSLILDRTNKIAYACRSIRTDGNLLNEWADKLGYRLGVFNAKDEDESNSDIVN